LKHGNLSTLKGKAMTETLISITGRELIRRILDGERDFSRTRLTPSTSLHKEEAFQEMNAYLQRQDLRTAPIIAEGADWRGLCAPGLFLQSARLAGADLSGANLSASDLRRALFNDAKLIDANLESAIMIHCRFVQTDLTGANMRGADMYEAKINGAALRNTDLTFAHMPRVAFESGDLTGAAVGGVNFYRADLRRVFGLDSVRDLGRALFHHTAITRNQFAAIQLAMNSMQRFDVRDD
jgi:uncharacterized protein YjbI with pentapeptide repeats